MKPVLFWYARTDDLFKDIKEWLFVYLHTINIFSRFFFFGNAFSTRCGFIILFESYWVAKLMGLLFLHITYSHTYKFTYYCQQVWENLQDGFRVQKVLSPLVKYLFLNFIFDLRSNTIESVLLRIIRLSWNIFDGICSLAIILFFISH